MNEWEELISARDSVQGYHTTDEFDDVHASLILLHDVVQRLREEPALWKWAIIAGHSALQGACVCILTGTDGLGALDDKSTKMLHKKLYKEGPDGRLMDDDSVEWPRERVALLPELLERLPEGLAIRLPKRDAEHWGWNDAGDLRRLHEYRNQFVHFPPVWWSLETAGLPRILHVAINLTRKICTSSAYNRLNRFSETNAEQLCGEISEKLRDLSIKE